MAKLTIECAESDRRGEMIISERLAEKLLDGAWDFYSESAPVPKKVYETVGKRVKKK